MKLIALCMAKNEEYWIWYALTSVQPWVDEIHFFDNHSEDRTLEIVRGMKHLGDRLRIHPEYGGESEQANREGCLETAREAGGTHVLFLDGDEVHIGAHLAFARRLLEVTEHEPPLPDPPRNPEVPGDHSPTDGILVKNIGFRPVHPGYEGPGTSIPQDLLQPDGDHGCYNFAIRISSLCNLRGNGLEWGRHGYLETGGVYIQSSSRTLWCPRLHYYHFTHHPRSSARKEGGGVWIRKPQDLGSVPVRPSVEVPEVLFRPDGPANPTLEAWGLRDRDPSDVGFFRSFPVS